MLNNDMTKDEYNVLSNLFLISKSGIIDSVTLKALSSYLGINTIRLRKILSILEEKEAINMIKDGRKYIYRIDTNIFKKH